MMLAASVCKSSESSGDKRHDLLEIRLDVPQQRVDLEALAFVERLGSRARRARADTGGMR